VKRWSLSGRLSRRVMLGVSLGWLMSLCIGMWVIAHEMTELLDETLEAQSKVILALTRASDADPVALSEGLQLRIVRPGALLEEAPWPPLAVDGQHDRGGWHISRVTDPQTGVSVELGQETAWRRDELYESGRAFLLLMFVMLAILLVVVRRTVWSAMRPARSFAGRMAARNAMDLSPLDADDLPAELAPIPQALNGYLSRIETLLQSERRFAADAAHELRTPIATAAAQAQLLVEGRADWDAPQRLAAALARLGRLIERLLQLARAEAGIGGSAARADLVSMLRMLVAEAGAGRIVFDDSDLERAEVAMDPDALAILLSNLIRNACEHGSGLVRITLRNGPCLEIENPASDGASFEFERFGKGSASRGTGLGLAIVEAIARQNGLQVSSAVQDGTARVVIAFAPC
jgi:two-component system, OmpR family, sensor kinase